MPEANGKGLLSFTDAVEAARTVIADAAADPVTEPATQAVASEGVVADHAEVDVLEHPETNTPVTEKFADEQSLFGDVLEDLSAPALESVEVPDIREQLVEDHRLEQATSVNDLIEGYLRQADYTKKTQALADERRQFEQDSAQATRLLEALKEDPAGTIASLAVEVGLLKESQLSADLVARLNREHRVPSREEVEAQVEARAQALLEEDPRVREAEDARIMREVNQQFADIETKHGVKFSTRDKEAILENAVRMETHRLDLAYLDLKDRAERLRAERKTAQQSAPQAPSAGRVEDSTSTQPQEPARTVSEAWKRAKATLANQS